MRYPFNENEMKITMTQHMKTAVLQNDVNGYTYPITARENYSRTLRLDKPVWMATLVDKQMVVPECIPDNPARGACLERPLALEEKGGKDMFGIDWEFVPEAGGSMVRPGKPLLSDISEWKDKVQFPDIDSWDWEKSARNYEKILNPDLFHNFTFHSGFWFERLISFMDFENAALALIDDDAKEDVHALFEKTTEVGCKLVDKVLEYFDVDGFYVHDDWGTMRAPFFSPAVAEEMIVPHMKVFTDHIHSKGKLADLHSCGKNEIQVPNYIKAGWDFWMPMDINDTKMLFDKYGDKISLGACIEPYDVTTASEEEQRQRARKYVDDFCAPGKTAMINIASMEYLTPIFGEEVYRYSRQKYGEIYG